jgi:negative regulator of flagellin synthesis FlgM
VSNKINDLAASVTSGHASGSVAPSRDAASGSTASTAAAPASGEVHITDTATQLVALEQGLRDSPAVDPVRVATLSSAIESGQYSVQPEHIAAQLMQMEHALKGLPDGQPAVADEE